MAGLFEDFDPFASLNANQLNTRSITRGSLVSFTYSRSFSFPPNQIHDTHPMVIITDVWPKYIRGVNLHYLTFPYIKRLLTMAGGNTGFSYSSIKPDRYMASAFRMYARVGMQQPKRLDTEFLLRVLASVRSFSPGELEAIKQSIQMQIQARLQAKANELAAFEQQRSSVVTPNLRQQNRVPTGQTGLQSGLNQQSSQPAPTQQPPQSTGGPQGIEPAL